jgi:hypothetical protein
VPRRRAVLVTQANRPSSVDSGTCRHLVCACLRGSHSRSSRWLLVRANLWAAVMRAGLATRGQAAYAMVAAGRRWTGSRSWEPRRGSLSWLSPSFRPRRPVGPAPSIECHRSAGPGHPAAQTTALGFVLALPRRCALLPLNRLCQMNASLSSSSTSFSVQFRVGSACRNIMIS